MKVALLFFVFVVASCTTSKSVGDTSPPACVEAYTKSVKTLAIHTQVIDGEAYYWIETGARAYDGTESVVDKDCNEVCQIGGMMPTECSKQYEWKNWKEIWKK